MLTLKEFLKNFTDLEGFVQIREFYFVLTKKQKELLPKKPVFIGYCLGKKKGSQFLPSVGWLDQIAVQYQKAVMVDAKTEWLFICGRDIFNVQEVLGSPEENELVLVLNRFKECIGIAQYTTSPNKKNPIRHVYDIGDYLRRERKRKL